MNNRIRMQLSSGLGPEECELAVGKLLRIFQQEDPTLEVLEMVRGTRPDSYRSVLIACQEDLAKMEGTVKWICQSPYRPRHRRKNWYVDVSLTREAVHQTFEKELVRFETFRSGGKGGQHVNKVETGVRAIYLPTGMAVTATEARSQQLNKRLALERLCAQLVQGNVQGEEALRRYNRLEHLRLERGNPVRVYEGMQFKRVL